MLLINPATDQFGGFLSRYIPLGLPIAIGTLAGYLKHYGHQVNVADDEIEKLDENNIENYLKDLPKLKMKFRWKMSMLLKGLVAVFY